MNFQDESGVNGTDTGDLSFSGYEPFANENYVDQQYESSGSEDSYDNVPVSGTAYEDQLYADARITEEQSRLIILAYTHRYNLTKEALEDLLELVEFHTPIGTKLVKSKYLVKKFIEAGSSNFEQRHYYCDNCTVYLGCSPSTNVCTKCSTLNTPLKEKSGENYFYVFDPEPQIVEFLETQHFKKLTNVNTAPNLFEDIIDGGCYKNLGKSSQDFTCCMNTDGISPFKSSNYQMWPYFISLNEFPYRIR
ncbi:unnamed protein product, partial [Allacma fusca]